MDVFYFVHSLCLSLSFFVSFGCLRFYWVIWFSSISYVALFHVFRSFARALVQLNVHWNRTQSNWKYFFFVFCYFYICYSSKVFWMSTVRCRIENRFFLLLIYFTLSLGPSIHCIRNCECGIVIVIVMQKLMLNHSLGFVHIAIDPVSLIHSNWTQMRSFTYTCIKQWKWIENGINKRSTFFHHLAFITHRNVWRWTSANLILCYTAKCNCKKKRIKQKKCKSKSISGWNCVQS